MVTGGVKSENAMASNMHQRILPRMNRRCIWILLSLPLLCQASFAQAYLDPGTGSIILQGILASVAAAVAFGGMYWQRVKLFFNSLFSSSEPKDPEPEQTLEE